LAPGDLPVDLGLLPLRRRAFATDVGFEAVDLGPGAIERLPHPREGFVRPPEHVTRGGTPRTVQPLALVRPPIACVGDSLAFVGEPLPFVGEPLPFVGEPLTLVRANLSVGQLMPRLLEPTGTRARWRLISRRCRIATASRIPTWRRRVLHPLEYGPPKSSAKNFSVTSRPTSDRALRGRAPNYASPLQSRCCR
jgi:hypothetical protein